MGIERKETGRIEKKEVSAGGVRIAIMDNGKEIARAHLYLLTNDLHKEPFGLLEDVYVEEGKRGKGLGSEITKLVIEEAKKQNCYKLICTSRYGKEGVHEMYKKLGFSEHGKEFRMDFIKE
jgi:GNAT superfamily N-acetyltransferase